MAPSTRAGTRVHRIRKAPRLRPSPDSRKDVTRAEYNYIIGVLNDRSTIINELRSASEVQFKRIAQIQAELDEVKRLLAKSRRL